MGKIIKVKTLAETKFLKLYENILINLEKINIGQ